MMNILKPTKKFFRNSFFKLPLVSKEETKLPFPHKDQTIKKSQSPFRNIVVNMNHQEGEKVFTKEGPINNLNYKQRDETNRQSLQPVPLDSTHINQFKMPPTYPQRGLVIPFPALPSIPLATIALPPEKQSYSEEEKKREGAVSIGSSEGGRVSTKLINGVDASKAEKNKAILNGKEQYYLETFQRSNQDTCLIHKPSVKEGDWVQSGDLLTDCASSVGGELSLGQNLLIAYMPWEGYNFEDAILISERLVMDDLYTSVHIERYELETQETQLGSEQITRNVPDVSEEELAQLDSFGIIKLGSWVEEGNILVGKITPVNKKNISAYQKLLYTILEKQVRPFKDSSLRAPKGIKAKVIDIKYFLKSSNKATLKKEQNYAITSSFPSVPFPTEKERGQNICSVAITNSLNTRIFSYNSRKKRKPIFSYCQKLNNKSKSPFQFDFKLQRSSLNNSISMPPSIDFPSQRSSPFRQKGLVSRSAGASVGEERLASNPLSFTGDCFAEGRNSYRPFREGKIKSQTKEIHPAFFKENPMLIKKQILPAQSLRGREMKMEAKKEKILKHMEKIHIYLAEKRKVQVGDKMAGRHGNKGIVSQILPLQDMPYLPDGTPIDMVLNPLGVPSRMNVGQIYECLLGLAGKFLGENYKVSSFDEIYGPEASRSFVFNKLLEARSKTGLKWLFDPNSPGKIRLYDGRNGECFDQKVTVGQAYMLRLVHMVDDKIHCLTPDHDVLTTNGWKPIGNVNVKDKVATLTPTGELLYENPTKVFHYPNYKGSLYCIKNSNVDLKVTLNHRMYVRKGNAHNPPLFIPLSLTKQPFASAKQPPMPFSHSPFSAPPFGESWKAEKHQSEKGKPVNAKINRLSNNVCFEDYKLVEANSIIGKHVQYLKNANWITKDYQIVLPSLLSNSVLIPEKKVNMSEWLIFFGIWISVSAKQPGFPEQKQKKGQKYLSQILLNTRALSRLEVNELYSPNTPFGEVTPFATIPLPHKELGKRREWERNRPFGKSKAAFPKLGFPKAGFDSLRFKAGCRVSIALPLAKQVPSFQPSRDNVLNSIKMKKMRQCVKIPNKVQIINIKPSLLSILGTVVSRLGYKYINKGNTLTIYNKQLSTFLKSLNMPSFTVPQKGAGFDFLKGSAWQKGRTQNQSFPTWVWKLSQKQAQQLIYSMCLASGCYEKASFYYDTNSIKLADDVMRLALHAGWSAEKSLSPTGISEGGLEKFHFPLCSSGKVGKINEVHSCLPTTTPTLLKGVKQTINTTEILDYGRRRFDKIKSSQVQQINWRVSIIKSHENFDIINQDLTATLTKSYFNAPLTTSYALPAKTAVSSLPFKNPKQSLQRSRPLPGLEEKRVETSTSSTFSFIPDGEKKMQQEEKVIPYEGPVYCLSVPNEVFYVRRNGIPVWTGNSRSTGPYSLVTQQPLRGRSKQGGQRLGEMEVWALEGYGAAFTLLEMLTIKSDDMTGRMTLWSNLILNKDIAIGTPESFKVLICELQALCLDIGLFRYSESNNKNSNLREINNLINLP